MLRSLKPAKWSTFVAWHQLFPTGVGEQALCAFQSPFPLHIASQWQY